MREAGSVFDKHQIKIAKDTLKMSSAGSMIMGGMSKDQAREVLRKAGYSDRQIAKMEESQVIEIKEEVSIVQEDGSKIILEKGDKVEVINEASDLFRDCKMWFSKMIHTISPNGAGYAFMENLLEAISRFNPEETEEIVNGIEDSLKEWSPY